MPTPPIPDPATMEWRDYPLPGRGEPENGGGAGSHRITVRVFRGLANPELEPAPPRDILVALPPGYENLNRRYPVVYMQDGQNLFDPATSHAGDWGLAALLEAHAARGLEVIVVGIPNAGPRRGYEYTPFHDPEHRAGGGGGSVSGESGGGDRYLAFLVNTVKPLVDESFRTQPGRANTVIAGSSLGGLISLYALHRHAGTFGAAAVLSPALWLGKDALFSFLRATAPHPVGRIYLDVGTEEGERALTDVRELRDLLVDLARELSYVEDEGGRHHETDWGRRFGEAMPFLFGNRESGIGNRAGAPGSRFPDPDSRPSDP